jgi:hypothetical protein
MLLMWQPPSASDPISAGLLFTDSVHLTVGSSKRCRQKSLLYALIPGSPGKSMDKFIIELARDPSDCDWIEVWIVVVSTPQQLFYHVL